jgi:hypothetical protein
MLDVNTDKLLQTQNDKWQTRPLVRKDAPQRKDSNFQKTTFGQKAISGHKSQSGLDTLAYWLIDWLTDWLTDGSTVSCNVISTSTSTTEADTVSETLFSSYLQFRTMDKVHKTSDSLQILIAILVFEIMCVFILFWTNSVVLWSKFLATDSEVRFRFT